MTTDMVMTTRRRDEVRVEMETGGGDDDDDDERQACECEEVSHRDVQQQAA
jgi:hypothetical protein